MQKPAHEPLEVCDGRCLLCDRSLCKRRRCCWMLKPLFRSGLSCMRCTDGARCARVRTRPPTASTTKASAVVERATCCEACIRRWPTRRALKGDELQEIIPTRWPKPSRRSASAASAEALTLTRRREDLRAAERTIERLHSEGARADAERGRRGRAGAPARPTSKRAGPGPSPSASSSRVTPWAVRRGAAPRRRARWANR